MARDATTVYTDGACSGNPGPGGWAWAVPGGRWATGAEPLTTNQRMEIQAVLSAVTSLDGALDVVSDSTYVVNCFRDRWWEGWIERGWKNKARQPVANRDLWEPLIDAYRSDPMRVRFQWVKGHGDDAMNVLVDRLAVRAAQTQRAESGDTAPAAADIALPPARDARAPAARKLVVTGLKPTPLGGYLESDMAAAVRAKLAEIIAAKKTMHPDLAVLTGLSLGAEQLGAEAAAAVGVPYVAVLPYPDPDSVWAPASRSRFRALIASAADVVVLQETPPATKQSAGAALARRDAWLVRNGDEAIVVWDGRDEFVGKTVRSMRDHLGEDEVWVLEP